MSEFAQVKKRNKYGAKKIKVDGIVFDSLLEAQYYKELKLQKRVGIIESFEMQVPFTLLGGFEVGNRKVQAIKYIADFIVTMKSGDVKVIDVKGLETEVFKIKRKLYEAQYGELTIVKKKGGRFYEF